MIIEDIKEPCVDCVHESMCTIKHPELLTKPDTIPTDYCEKLDKYSRYVGSRV